MRKFYPVNQLPDVLVLGAQTEHGVTELCFDCSVWLDIWPELELSIWVTPPAGDQYPAGAHMDGKILVWPVSAADTACVGKGRMEIMGVSEGKKKLSAIADTLITATSTDTSPNPPPVHEAWVEKVALDALAAKNAAGEAEKFARAAEEAKETAIEAANAAGDVIGAKNEALDEISNQKENSVKAVQDQQAVSVKTVQDQQSASVMAVDQAKSASVKALQDESANQQNAVAAKGKETVDSIPADYTNLAGKVGQLSEDIDDGLTSILNSNTAIVKGAVYTAFIGSALSSITAIKYGKTYVFPIRPNAEYDLFMTYSSLCRIGFGNELPTYVDCPVYEGTNTKTEVYKKIVNANNYKYLFVMTDSGSELTGTATLNIASILATQKDLESATAKTNVLDCFGRTRQRVCEFYDVFGRADVSGFGTNGEKFNWDSAYSDCASIANKKLVIAAGEKKSYVPIAATGFLNDFTVEGVVVPGGEIGLSILGNDTGDFYGIMCTSGTDLTIRVVRIMDGIEYSVGQKTIPSANAHDFHAVTVHYLRGGLYVYVDMLMVMRVAIDASNMGDRVGVIRAETDTQYAAFSVFTFRDFLTYDTRDNVDFGFLPGSAKDNKNGVVYIHKGDGNDWKIVDSTVSPMAELHTVYYAGEQTTNSQCHSETVVNDAINQTALKHVIVEFDKMFPADFVPDNLNNSEIIFQSHGRNNYEGHSFGPTWYVTVKRSKIMLGVRGSDDRSMDETPQGTSIDICDLVTDEWIHFKLDIQEGCSVYHRPTIRCWVNGKYAGTINAPNQYCEDLASFIQYGIYKYNWQGGLVPPVIEGTDVRRCYTDNVVIRY